MEVSIVECCLDDSSDSDDGTDHAEDKADGDFCGQRRPEGLLWCENTPEVWLGFVKLCLTY
jgi:hypothetical protein